MSQKRSSTISAKPEVKPGIEAWIGGNAAVADKQTDKPASQLVNKQTSQHDDNNETTAMLSARVPANLIRKLRIRAATEGRPIQEILADLLREYLDNDD